MRRGQLRWVPAATARRGAVPTGFAAAAPAIAATAAEMLPEPGSPLAPRDAFIFLLHTAAEIEHTLMVQYLYAALSLERVKWKGASVPHKPTEIIDGWYEKILWTAKEEMGHFLTLQNILLLVGGPLNFEREDLPFRTEFYPFSLVLEPLTRDSLARYIAAEMPDPETIPPTVLSPEEKAKILERATGSAGQTVNRVGLLYRQIIELCQALPESDFRADVALYQSDLDSEWPVATKAEVKLENGDVVSVGAGFLIDTPSNRAEAVRSLQAIALQGEATSPEMAGEPTSHFSRFLSIWNDANLPDERVVPQPWYPTRAVPRHPNTTTPLPPEFMLSEEERRWEALMKQGRITHTGARRTAELFNLRYRILLYEISYGFSLKRSETLRTDLMAWAQNEMYNLSAISHALTTLPREAMPGGVAGPPFELPYSLALPTPTRDRARLLLSMIDASNQLIADIRKALKDEEVLKPDGEFDGVLKGLLDSDQQQAEVLKTDAEKGV